MVEHEYRCARNHPEVRRVVAVKFPDSPTAPQCGECGALMVKVWAAPRIDIPPNWKGH